MSNKIIGYMCGVDWQHELGEASGGNTIYPSIEDLKRHRQCWKQCGIVAVTVEEQAWVEGQDIGGPELELRDIERFNWNGFAHEAVQKHFEGEFTYVGTTCVLGEYHPVAIYHNAKPNRAKNHKDYLLLGLADNLFEDVGGKPVTIVRGMDQADMEKWTTVSGIICVHCNDVVYSVMRHDDRHCKCGKSSVDGGRDYTKIGHHDQQPGLVKIDLLTRKLVY